MVYTTKYTPIELATAITMILGVYVGVETFKPSVPIRTEKIIEPNDKN
jgi:hypothetical protein